eukprot:scaffold85014_cov36-Tisochrysis_lutea.AAC.2
MSRARTAAATAAMMSLLRPASSVPRSARGCAATASRVPLANRRSTCPHFSTPIMLRSTSSVGSKRGKSAVMGIAATASSSSTELRTHTTPSPSTVLQLHVAPRGESAWLWFSLLSGTRASKNARAHGPLPSTGQVRRNRRASRAIRDATRANVMELPAPMAQTASTGQ